MDIKCIQPFYILFHTMRVILTHIFICYMTRLYIDIILYIYKDIYQSYEYYLNLKKTHIAIKYLHVDATKKPTNNQSTNKQYITDHKYPQKLGCRKAIAYDKAQI